MRRKEEQCSCRTLSLNLLLKVMLLKRGRHINNPHLSHKSTTINLSSAINYVWFNIFSRDIGLLFNPYTEYIIYFLSNPHNSLCKLSPSNIDISWHFKDNRVACSVTTLLIAFIQSIGFFFSNNWTLFKRKSKPKWTARYVRHYFFTAMDSRDKRSRFRFCT